MQAKTQSEQELTLVITGLNETQQQQAAELARLKGALEEESCQRISAENQVGSLQQDKEHLESSLRTTITALEEHLDKLQEQWETRISSTSKRREHNKIAEGKPC